MTSSQRVLCLNYVKSVLDANPNNENFKNAAIAVLFDIVIDMNNPLAFLDEKGDANEV